MRRQDWVGKKANPFSKKKEKIAPPERLTIAQLEKRIGELNTRIRVGSDRVLFMGMEGNPRYNLANAFLGQLVAKRTQLQKELDNAVAWKEAGWED